MTGRASFVLILHALSSATLIAGDVVPDSCLCGIGEKVAVALGPGTGNLNGDAPAVFESDRFLWEPQQGERDWVYVVIHHSGTKAGSVEAIHNNHRQRTDSAGNPWLGIGYHFVIGNGSGMSDGSVESTFRWQQQIHGAHSGSQVHNANGIGICLIGNFEHDAPTSKQLTAVTQLVRKLSQRYRIPARLVIGHNTVKPTSCPGKNFPLQDVIRNSISEVPTES